MYLADYCFAPTAVLPPSSTVNAPSTSPRGIKRSRSPESYGDLPPGAEGDDVGMSTIPECCPYLGEGASCRAGSDVI